MNRNRKRNSGGISLSLLFAAVCVCLCCAPAAWAQVSVSVVEDTGDRIVLDYRLVGFESEPVEIDGRPYEKLSIPGEPVTYEAGSPALPFVHRSVIIPDTAAMTAQVLSMRYEERLAAIAPSKGLLDRSVDPATVPYVFGEAYQTDAFAPSFLARAGEPYILRDHRGVVVQLRPFQYNPVRGVLRVYTELRVELRVSGTSTVNVPDRSRVRDRVKAFESLYAAHFLNAGQPSTAGYEHTIDEQGDILVICHDPWVSEMASYESHKEAMGYQVDVVPVSEPGNDASSIKSYIQNRYDTGDLAFVLLVGDAAEVDTPQASGGASDPSYSKLAGSDDYPDIMVGRFSAQTADEVRTQVERTVDYESAPAIDQEWFWKGTGIASDEGGGGQGDEGQSDRQHMQEIRGWLLDAGYTEVDEIYDPGASDDDVSNALNAGRGIVNYTGHGSATSWGTTGFNNADINALVNDNTLPFIVSVACNNGEFDNYSSCFGETWLRATNDTTGEPTGAVAIYASSISQSWSPPMEGQDEFNLLLTDPTEPYQTFGGLAFAGSCSMMDDYGSGGVDMFNTWIVFGDPSLQVVGEPEPASGLRVSPGEDFVSEGPAGGPLSPESRTYTLENVGEEPLDFDVRVSSYWVIASPDSGSLASGESREVVVSLTDAARNFDNGQHLATVEFVNVTTHEGDTSRDVQVKIGRRLTAESWSFEQDPGWQGTGEWEFGTPLGRGGSGPLHADPTSGATGSDVYGVNLAGDVQAVVGGPYLLTTGSIDLSAVEQVELSFMRWLNQVGQPYAQAWLEVSANDGASWTRLWDTGTEQGVADEAWVAQEFDVGSLLSGATAARVRWGYQVDRPVAYIGTGWNIDDVKLTGATSTEKVTLDVTRTDLSWSSVPGAVGYDVVRGDVATLLSSGGDFSVATEECLADDLDANALSYGVDPAAGTAMWMLVRGVSLEGPLTWQSLAGRQVGVRDDGIDAAPNTCP